MTNAAAAFTTTVKQVNTACGGGGVPCRATPPGFVLGVWALDGVAADDRATFDLALRHWALACAFLHVGDVVRCITFASALYPRGDGPVSR